jgi:hypothetical protein
MALQPTKPVHAPKATLARAPTDAPWRRQQHALYALIPAVVGPNSATPHP